MAHVPFGQYLLTLQHAPGVLGELAQAAAADRGFPRHGDPQAVSRRLHQHEAPVEFHEALEDAVLDWKSVQ